MVWLLLGGCDVLWGGVLCWLVRVVVVGVVGCVGGVVGGVVGWCGWVLGR